MKENNQPPNKNDKKNNKDIIDIFNYTDWILILFLVLRNII